MNPQTRVASALILPGLILALASPAMAQKKVPEGANVLILSGGQREHHAYREQSLYLAQRLEDTGRYQVTITEDAAVLESPAVSRYDILMAIADRRDPESHLTNAQQEALFAFVRSGGGYVSIHGADNTPSDLDEDQTRNWKDLLGGIYSHKGLPDGKAIMGDYTIQIADPSHPITQGLKDFPLRDELYSNMQMKDDVEPLAIIEHNGVTWPVAWTYTFGKGSVFHTSLGHRSWKSGSPDPLANPSLLKLVIQGVDWVADRSTRSASPEAQ